MVSRVVQFRIPPCAANHCGCKRRPLQIERHIRLVYHGGKEEADNPPRLYHVRQTPFGHAALGRPELLQPITQRLGPRLGTEKNTLKKRISRRLRARGVHPNKRDAFASRDRARIANMGHQRRETRVRPITQLSGDFLHQRPCFRTDSRVVPQRIGNRGETTVGGEGDLLQGNHDEGTMTPSRSFAGCTEGNLAN